jgi:hypothetical protein
MTYWRKAGARKRMAVYPGEGGLKYLTGKIPAVLFM